VRHPKYETLAIDAWRSLTGTGVSTGIDTSFDSTRTIQLINLQRAEPVTALA